MNDTHATIAPNKLKASILTDRMSGWRLAKDRLTNITITGGGLGVLMAILLIFFYLFYEILPLFNAAHVEEQQQYQLADIDSRETLFLAMEEQAEVAVLLNSQAEALFFETQTGAKRDLVSLPFADKVASFALNSQQNPLFALGSDRGGVLLAKPVYKISYPNDKRLISPVIEYPYGDEMITLSDQSLQSLAVRESESELLLVAVAGGDLVGQRFVKEEDFLSDEITLQQQTLSLPKLDIKAQWLMIGPDQRWLYVFDQQGQYRLIELNDMRLFDSGQLSGSGSLSSIRFLLGGISVMVADDQGVVSQWFVVRQEGLPPRFEKIRHFQSSDVAINNLLVEHRRKGFLTINDNNQLDIFYTTSQRQLLSKPMGPSAITDVAISPRANALLSRDDSGQLTYWRLENKHPEVSWQALWQKVWYESYPEPDYIWQSSASNNDFESKYSFAPLAFGTLKAAFYAMLIATPLAICGAIYTAYFMTPSIRRKVKPLIELMEALPTVILGFLAGLWLAPFIERHLPGFFSVFLMMPIGVLVFAYLWSKVPSVIRHKVPEGFHAVLLVPVVIAITWASFASSGSLEAVFFAGDMRAWLTHDMGISFDQRNALVVGVAMGFAVIPTIFSITEDAIFSVPKSLTYGSLALGATPWQTLVGVVIPTASPGIFSALMIGMGRAVGETMIVLMATGNTPIMDANIFEGMRTLAANIAVEIGETEVDSSHFRVLFLAAFVLFLFTFVVNTAAEIVRQRLRKKYGSL